MRYLSISQVQRVIKAAEAVDECLRRFRATRPPGNGRIVLFDPEWELEDACTAADTAKLHEEIESLTDKQRGELLAVYWLGRERFSVNLFADLARNADTEHILGYLSYKPQLAQHLRRGLQRLGRSAGAA
jgi:hypothetical protein